MHIVDDDFAYLMLYRFTRTEKVTHTFKRHGMLIGAYLVARWLSGRVSDSGARGRGFETYRRRVVSLSKALYSPKVQECVSRTCLGQNSVISIS